MMFAIHHRPSNRFDAEIGAYTPGPAPDYQWNSDAGRLETAAEPAVDLWESVAFVIAAGLGGFAVVWTVLMLGGFL